MSTIKCIVKFDVKGFLTKDEIVFFKGGQVGDYYTLTKLDDKVVSEQQVVNTIGYSATNPATFLKKVL